MSELEVCHKIESFSRRLAVLLALGKARTTANEHEMDMIKMDLKKLIGMLK